MLSQGCRKHGGPGGTCPPRYFVEGAKGGTACYLEIWQALSKMWLNKDGRGKANLERAYLMCPFSLKRLPAPLLANHLSETLWKQLGAPLKEGGGGGLFKHTRRARTSPPCIIHKLYRQFESGQQPVITPLCTLVTPHWKVLRS